MVWTLFIVWACSLVPGHTGNQDLSSLRSMPSPAALVSYALQPPRGSAPVGHPAVMRLPGSVDDERTRRCGNLVSLGHAQAVCVAEKRAAVQPVVVVVAAAPADRHDLPQDSPPTFVALCSLGSARGPPC